MCGFAAYFDPEGAIPESGWLAAAAENLAHRGPDDAGFLAESGIGLAFRRLSIVDLATGHQPLANEDGSIWIVFNGEIYNHTDLRRDLEARGHRYHTTSDTESIVHAYEEWGEDCVERLRGMFAFALWDRTRQRLFVARDRLGIKPLYWARAGRAFVCASEVKALFVFPGVRREVHLPALVEHLTLRYTAAPGTLFAGIEKLPPGHHLSVDARGVTSPRRYWRLDYEPKVELSDGEALVELDRRLTESVRLRLMSEVPLGALLSGGVDSSVVVAIMSRLLERPVQTFSVGFDEPGPYSELPFARRVAEHLGTEHRELVVGPQDVEHLLPRLAWHQDEPVSEPAAIPTFLVSRLARETVTVVLTGEGGDELFGGYPKYAAEPLVRGLAALPSVLRDPLIGAGVDRLPFGFRKLQVVARSARFRDEAERLSTWFAGLAGEERRRLLDDRLLGHDHVAAAAFRQALDASPARSPLDRMLDVDLKLWLADDLLMKMDKMSMAASIEARVPLLDHPLVEWTARLPNHHKVRGTRGKILLKRLARTLLPREVVDRPKVGFTVPLSPWFRGPLRDLLADTLLGPSSLGRGYYRPETLRRYVEDHLQGRRDRARELWTLLTLELWHRAFIDEAPERRTPYVIPPRVAHPVPDGGGATTLASPRIA
ncbi:MAG TPA: asparagine synthase (glutamine-hydrolyzing) [Candidatus Limnocylindria bacterium]|nr:asparagine synthase (glutamine-hydrolyzing) [Candidatus Limnocylindria bacterium]